ncbi:hypothetical protein JXR93_00610 [bacterium]|nr:hypothetical protein [bacterium]
MKKYILSILLMATLFYGCGPEMTSPVEVNKLRVLGIKADKPWASPGEEVTLTTLITAPEDYTGEYHNVWLVCDPEAVDGSNGSFLSCMNFEGGGIIGQPGFESDTHTFRIPEDSLTAFGQEEKLLYVVLILCEDTMENCTNLAMGSGGVDPSSFLISFKRVKVVQADAEKNSNPVLSDIYMNDTKLESDTLQALTEDVDFKAAVTQDSFEKQLNYDDQEVDERITFSWVSTKGSIDYFYTNQKRDETLEEFDENSFSPPKDGGSYKIYIIAQDDRGGMDWRVLTVSE